MTKMIRIENADTSSYKVKAYVEDLIDGVWTRNGTVVDLDHPAAMREMYLTNTRRVVVEEVSG